MDGIIEGTAVVKHETKHVTMTQWQATIRAKMDHKLERIENVPVELPGNPTKNDAWTVLVPSLVRKSNRTEVRMLTEAFMLGGRPEFKKIGATGFYFEFHNLEEGAREDTFIEGYTITFIKL